jgi:hypothetical protein
MNLLSPRTSLRFHFSLVVVLIFTLLLPKVGLALVSADTPQSISGAIVCSDYYKPNSVRLNLAPTLSETVPGVPMAIAGNIKNEHKYPIVEGQLYMKVFKAEGETYSQVAQVLLEEGMTFREGEQRDLAFEWLVPLNFNAGEYHASFYFVANGQFDTTGYINSGGRSTYISTFSVSEANANPLVTFDQNSIKLNDKEFGAFSLPHAFGREGSVVVTADIQNPTDIDKVVEVTWISFKNKAIPSEEVGRITQGISIDANETKNISYEVPFLDLDEKIIVQGIVTDGDGQSIIQPYFLQYGEGNAHLNFVSVAEYPYQSNHPAVAFACVDLPNDRGYSLTLTTTDTDGNVLNEYTYDADILGETTGVASVFTPEKDLENFILSAKLTKEGNIIEEISVEYQGSSKSGQTNNDTNPLTDSKNTYLYLLIVTVIIIAGLAFVFILYRQKNEKGQDLSMINPTE